MGRLVGTDGMTPERHEAVMRVFNTAAALSPEEQAAYLQRTCADDAPLRQEVESLLEHDRQVTCVVDQPLLGPGFNLSQFVEADPALAENMPATVGPYRILDVLGMGNMGVVYRAQQQQPEREVAVKVIRPDKASPALFHRFAGEIESLGRLRHPGIAHIHDAGTVDTPQGPHPYIAMELVDGPRLADFVRERALDERGRLELLAQVCDAVEHAHEQGIIHRDLKPAHILVEGRNGRVQPRVLDFGVARWMNTPARDATYATMPGQLIGTLAYMSPEQVAGDPAEIDRRADVYALGALGYELLAGRLPIDVRGKSLVAALDAIRHEAPPPLAAHERRFRGDLSVIFGKALAKEKSQRYASAAALASDIRRYLGNRPILAREPSLPYVVWKFVRRHRTVATVALLGALLAAHGLVRAHLSARAERFHLHQTRSIAGYLARDFAASLDRLSGSREVRAALLERLRSHVEQLRAENPGDIELMTAHADILTHLSDMAAEVDRHDEAMGLRKRALALRETLVAAEPDNGERRAALSIIKVKIGDLHNGRLDRETAGRWYYEALAIDETLAAAVPDDVHYLSNLAFSYLRLGALVLNNGDHARARERLGQAIETFRQLLILQPGRVTALHGRCDAEGLLAALASIEGRDVDAGAHKAMSLRCAEQALQLEPDNRRCQQMLASAQLGYAAHLLRDGDHDGSLALIDAAARMGRGLHLVHPHDPAHTHLMCRALMQRAEVCMHRGDPAAAVPHAEEAVALAQALVARDGANVRHLRRLAQACSAAYQCCHRAGDEGAAGSHWRSMLSARCQIADHPQATPGDLHVAAGSLLGGPYPQHRDARRALQYAERAVELTEGAVAVYWYRLGLAHEALGAPAEAVQCLEQARAQAAAEDELLSRIDARLARLRDAEPAAATP